jgi:hypothetical protein
MRKRHFYLTLLVLALLLLAIPGFAAKAVKRTGEKLRDGANLAPSRA